MRYIYKIGIWVIACFLWINTISTYVALRQKTKKVDILRKQVTDLHLQQNDLKKTLEYRKTLDFRSKEFANISHHNSVFIDKLRREKPKGQQTKPPIQEWLETFKFRSAQDQ
jgi:hypothetical protein